ncbi:early nodulin-like protein 14 isoform X1 [Actinidia eriantha]|uniref:early nodulin-like protein 14 isoform X1 n=1 Tax=Actinidia eriantha TaxID=165200 RepID=UPI00258C85CE|nr:early nodulin-like protein 14 isoform X1 [Actinidia eriantha]
MAPLRYLILCLAFMLVVLFTFSEGKEFLVGGRENSWKVPSSPEDFNKWSGKMRFLIGDFLVLNYDPKLDSVLQVTVEDYKVCSRSNPIKSYTDGNTTISLDHSGAFYFISGAKGHCEEGQKLEVRVLSAKHAPRAHPPATSPVSAPVPAPAPSPYPAEIIPPVTAPSGGASGLKVGVCVGVVGVLGSLVGLAFVM